MSVDAVHARAVDALRRNEMDLLARLLADNPSLAHVPSEEGSYLIDRCACPSSTDPSHGGYAQALAMLHNPRDEKGALLNLLRVRGADRAAGIGFRPSEL